MSFGDDFIALSDSERRADGLRAMMNHAFGDDLNLQHFVDVETALLVVYIAKAAEDKPEWFIGGKWAMIQAIEQRILKCLAVPLKRVSE